MRGQVWEAVPRQQGAERERRILVLWLLGDEEKEDVAKGSAQAQPSMHLLRASRMPQVRLRIELAGVRGGRTTGSHEFRQGDLFQMVTSQRAQNAEIAGTLSSRYFS